MQNEAKPLYKTADGEIRYRHDFLAAIYQAGMQGRNLRAQLGAIGRLEEFDRGTTPWSLPYTIG